jgi:hypothetical protein
MLIKARLQGHEFDLLTLAELFREGDPAVASDEEGYCLSFTASEGLLDDGARLSDAASVLLCRVNGFARSLNSDFRPVNLTGRFSDEAGRQHQVVLAFARWVKGEGWAGRGGPAVPARSDEAMGGCPRWPRSGGLIRRRQRGRLSCAPSRWPARAGGKLGCAVVRHS